MPKRCVCTAPGQFEIQDYEEQPLETGQVRIRSEFGAAKHGTEMAMIKGYAGERGRFDRELKLFVRDGQTGKAPFKGPAGIGNMTVGTVTEVGLEVEGIAEGDRLLSYGGFRQTHRVRTARAWKMPEGMSWKSAVCIDPADFAMAAVRDGNVRVGDAVAVFGMGAIGLMAVQIAGVSGAHPVIAVDPLANRREVASMLGADVVLDPTACDVGREIKLATDKRGVDVVIEYSGSRRAMQDALRSVAFGGNIVAGAFPPPYDAGLDFGAEAHLNIPNIIFSRACSEPNREHPRWNERRVYDTCWRLLCEGRITGEPIVSPVVAFEELPKHYPKIATDPGLSVKLGAEY